MQNQTIFRLKLLEMHVFCKQEQHDLLYAGLLQGQTIEQLFSSLPETIQYHDKRTWAMKRVGPLQYLFDQRGVDTPENPSEPITTSRYANGELRIPERAYGNSLKQNDLIFSPQTEAHTSPFAKFLYRRGPTFSHNLQAMTSAYYACFDKADFVQKAQQGLLAAKQVQE